MQIPNTVQQVLYRIEQNGYQGYVVGGCVRDRLLGRLPADWDVCTDASPETILSLFPDVPCIPTGLKHGTVTVVWDGEPIEVTTYRIESGYSDNRHPDQVQFVATVEEDLSRRDFTINAMAYHPERGLVDPYGGQTDLSAGILRCVGVPRQRFQEDALRILRCLRFASRYGFRIEPVTAEAVRMETHRLSMVAAERVRAELDRLLLGRAVEEILTVYADVLFHLIPEMRPMQGFWQFNPHHHLDVWGHTVQAVASSAEKLTVRLALLLHDIGKPQCFTRDADGVGHFYGHGAVGVEMAETILHRLRYDHHTVDNVLRLIRYHDVLLPTEERGVKRWLNRFGEDFLYDLLLVKDGDCLGQPTDLQQSRLQETEHIREMIRHVVSERQCFSLKDLAINGYDVLALGGYSGKQVGEALNDALEAVMDGIVANDRESLLELLKKT